MDDIELKRRLKEAQRKNADLKEELRGLKAPHVDLVLTALAIAGRMTPTQLHRMRPWLEDMSVDSLQGFFTNEPVFSTCSVDKDKIDADIDKMIQSKFTGPDVE